MNPRSSFNFRFLFLFLFMTGSQLVFSQYKISQMVDENKLKFPPPYKYDGFLMNEFNFELFNKNIPLEFVAFKKQEYQLIFCVSKFEEQVLVTIYDKDAPNVKVAEKLMDNVVNTWTFEPKKPGTYRIVYEVPPSNTDIEHKACVVMLIGFK